MDLQRILGDVGEPAFDDDAVARSRARVTAGIAASSPAAEPAAAAPAPLPPVSSPSQGLRRRFPASTWWPVAASIALVGLVVGAVSAASLWWPRDSGTVAATPSSTWKPAGDYLCGGTAVPASALVEKRRAADLGVAERDVLAKAVPELSDLEDWIVVLESTDELVLLTASEPPERGEFVDRPLPWREEDMAQLTVERSGPTGADWMPEWTVGYGTCVLTRDFGDIGLAGFELDPTNDPASRDLSLVVHDYTCGGRESDEFFVADIEQTAEEVSVVIGQKPSERAEFACLPLQPNLVPFTVTLDEPLGDRTAVDSSTASAEDVLGASPRRLPWQQPTAATVTDPVVTDDVLICGDVRFGLSAFDKRVPLSTLDEAQRDVIASSGFDVSEGSEWTVVETGPARVRALQLIDGEYSLVELTRLTLFGGYTSWWDLTDHAECDVPPSAG